MAEKHNNVNLQLEHEAETYVVCLSTGRCLGKYGSRKIYYTKGEGGDIRLGFFSNSSGHFVEDEVEPARGVFGRKVADVLAKVD